MQESSNLPQNPQLQRKFINSVALNISNFSKEEFEKLKFFLADKKQCKSLKFMFENIERFLFFTKGGGEICVYYDSNGFNGFTKEHPIYLPNKKYVSFDEFINIVG